MLMVLGYGIAHLYLTWILYLAIMNLSRAEKGGTLTQVSKYLAYPLLLVGYLLDCLLNLTVCSVMFLDAPQEWLASGRLQRYVDTDTGWRKQLALWLAHNLLDTFDPSGKHIKE